MKVTWQLSLGLNFSAFSGAFLSVFICVFLGRIQAEIVADEPKGPIEIKKSEYDQAELVGWKLLIRNELKESNPEQLSKALELLERQLDEIVRVVPGPAVEKLRSVPLWLSPVYPDAQPRAEYHPGAQWLIDHGRDPAMEKGVEFSNIEIFDAEVRRMPNFVLHELAHAYHDQFIKGGFSNSQIEMTYKNAKRAGIYDRVEQRFGDGRSRSTVAYAMSNPAEYFAESTEAFFSTNDFYPFTRKELETHDPAMTELLGKLWK